MQIIYAEDAIRGITAILRKKKLKTYAIVHEKLPFLFNIDSNKVHTYCANDDPGCQVKQST